MSYTLASLPLPASQVFTTRKVQVQGADFWRKGGELGQNPRSSHPKLLIETHEQQWKKKERGLQHACMLLEYLQNDFSKAKLPIEFL